jgi:hypothetical protein
VTFSTLSKREKPVRSRAYLEYIRQLPCVAAMVEGSEVYGCDAAHVSYPFPGWGARGKGEKVSDQRTVPLSRPAHDDQHAMSERAWWARLGINPVALCAGLAEVFPDVGAGVAVIRYYADQARRGLPQMTATTGGPVTRRPAGPIPVLIEAHYASTPPDEHGNRAVLVPVECGTKAHDTRVVWVAPIALQSPTPTHKEDNQNG